MIDPNYPINKVAALVVSKSREHGAEFSKRNLISSMSPLPTRMFCGPVKDDRTGVRFGRFTVIGYSTIIPGRGSLRNPGRWVVKCDCGRYQISTTKATKINSEIAMCKECINTQRLGNDQRTTINIE